MIVKRTHTPQNACTQRYGWASTSSRPLWNVLWNCDVELHINSMSKTITERPIQERISIGKKVFTLSYTIFNQSRLHNQDHIRLQVEYGAVHDRLHIYPHVGSFTFPNIDTRYWDRRDQRLLVSLSKDTSWQSGIWTWDHSIVSRAL